jgi:hypothetical protein
MNDRNQHQDKKHSLTPWTVAYGCVWDTRSARLLLADRDEPNTTPCERDANIEHAVRCVNDHPLLQQRIRDMEQYIALANGRIDDLLVERESMLKQLARLREAVRSLCVFAGGDDWVREAMTGELDQFDCFQSALELLNIATSTKKGGV